MYDYGESNLPPLADGSSVKCYFEGSCPLRAAGSAPLKHVCIPARGSLDHPKLLLVGEAPGGEEDAGNSPFVGKSGKLLREILSEVIGKDYEKHVAFTNSVRCYPQSWDPKTRRWAGRAPSVEEQLECAHYTTHEIDLIAPSVIVAVGGVAHQSLMGPHVPGITKCRGIRSTFRNLSKTYPLIPTLHPSYVLRNDLVDRDLLKSDIDRAWSLATGSAGRSSVVRNTHVITDVGAARTLVDTWISEYRSGKIPAVAWDLETSGETYVSALRPWDPTFYIIGVAVASTEEDSYFVTLRHAEAPDVDELAMKSVLRDLFVNVPVICHHAKFDITCTRSVWQVKEKKLEFDTMLASYLLNHEKYIEHGLKSLAQIHCGLEDYSRTLDDWFDAQKIRSSDRRMSLLPLDLLGTYAALDVSVTLSLYKKFAPSIVQEKLEYVFNLLLDAAVVFGEIEHRGVAIDKSYVDRVRQTYTMKAESLLNELRRTDKHVQKIERDTGVSFSPRSHAASLIYEHYGVPKMEQFTTYKKDAPSASDGAFIEIIKNVRDAVPGIDKMPDPDEDPTAYAGKSDKYVTKLKELKNLLNAVRKIREWRKIQKILTAYVHNLPKFTEDQVVPVPPRGTSPPCTVTIFHPSYLMHRVAGGRFSTSSPSLHILPWHSDPRRFFYSRWHKDGGLILNSDYSQLELRVLAALCGDQDFVKVFVEGRDIHLYVASRVFKRPESEIQKDERRFAKTISFGIVYSRGAKAIAEETGLTVQEAQRLLDDYFKEFPQLKKFIDDTKAYVTKNLSSRSAFGRIRHCLHGNSSDQALKAAALRAGFNSVIQGSASDCTLHAILQAQSEYRAKRMDSYVWGFVHDAILVDTAPGELWEAQRILTHAMEVDVPRMSPWVGEVPLTASHALEPRWDGGVEIESISMNGNHGELLVDGPIEFCQETLDQLHKQYNLEAKILKAENMDKREETMLRKSYEGNTGGDLKVKVRLVVSGLKNA